MDIYSLPEYINLPEDERYSPDNAYDSEEWIETAKEIAQIAGIPESSVIMWDWDSIKIPIPKNGYTMEQMVAMFNACNPDEVFINENGEVPGLRFWWD